MRPCTATVLKAPNSLDQGRGRQGPTGRDVTSYGVTAETYHDAEEDHEKRLHRRDPADGRGVVVRQRTGDVVGLEHADAVDQTEGAEETAPTAEHHGPGLEPAVRKVGRIDAARRFRFRRVHAGLLQVRLRDILGLGELVGEGLLLLRRDALDTGRRRGRAVGRRIRLGIPTRLVGRGRAASTARFVAFLAQRHGGFRAPGR
ncbi:hypothetical protein VTK73DRAFT_10205 [Phialemonium thermophilum]|uniref:Uncharacterized protein n=1 Tax=Phialemonium thermophilum TaxID=223376 RepID=A0ABR3VY58_9PEZI